MNTFSIDKGVTIRYPSTANLMIDSADGVGTTWEFQITRKQSIVNGFFSRVGATEVVFDWCEDNISSDLSNNWITADISGVPRTVFIPNGNYTVETALKYIASGFNDLSGVTGKACAAGAISTGLFAGLLFLPASGGQIEIQPGPLANALNFLTLVGGQLQPFGTPGYFFVPSCPDLRPHKYLDIVSEDLTYSQDLKDSSTQTYNRDVIVRWYFADDVPEQIDGFGFPILMGYIPFCRRRLYNPPKQIKWDNNLPLGNLRFQVYDENGNQPLTDGVDTTWLMTLQLTEN